MTAGGGGPPHADRVTVGNTPTVIATIQPSLLFIRNVGANTIYLGGSSVSTATGFPFKVDEILIVQTWPRSGALYGIVAAATEDVAVLSVA